MPKFISLVLLCLISLAGLPLASAAERDFTAIRNIVDTAIRPVMAEHHIPGMAIALTVRGQTMFFNYGVASKEEQTLVSEGTLFEIGSVSKVFTGVLASYAQVLGKLSLDDHPGKYLPQLKGSEIDEASLLNLGTYTAGGLPLQFPEDIAGNDEAIDYFRQWQPDSAPGTQRNYSNPSIGLLGHISGFAFNSNFADAMETRIFPKLGLSHSYIRVPEDAMGDYAWGYGKANKPIRVNPGVFDAEAYGVKSTAADMIRYVQANIEPSGLQEAMRHAIQGTHSGFFKVGGMVQGLGWELYPYPITLDNLLGGNSRSMIMESNAATPLSPAQRPVEPTLFNKTGSTNGFGAYVAFVPKEKIGIVMLANRNYPVPARIKAAHAILRQLTGAHHGNSGTASRSFD